ncbi:hypothetical protein GGR52DRAFT_411036 [Hypoxylon sp. FL1284]|nr:hypothetical protein GGR52DRAFT_411036 [Hypoxylon sp. FL1284]
MLDADARSGLASPPTPPSRNRPAEPGSSDDAVVRLPILRWAPSPSQLQTPSSRSQPRSAALAVQPLGWHRKLEGVYLFRYIDFLGHPAAQPAGRGPQIRTYFGPDDDVENRGGGKEEERTSAKGGMQRRTGGACDAVLLEARRWCCWAQGFDLPEPEMRWALTLVFDLVNVLIGLQRRAAAWKAVGGGYPGRNKKGADMNSEELFWLGRYYLFNLMGIVTDIRDELGIAELCIPAFAWRCPN